MKIKAIDILNSKEVLTKLGSVKFEDGITSYKLIRNIKNIGFEMDNLERAKAELFIKYGTRDKDTTKIPDDKKDQFLKELNALLGMEVEIDILPISPEKISGFSPFELMPIDWMFEIEKKEV
jgi:hypothetical protein